MTANTTVVLPLARPGQTVAVRSIAYPSVSGCQAEKEDGECHQNNDHNAGHVEPAVPGYQVDHAWVIPAAAPPATRFAEKRRG